VAVSAERNVLGIGKLEAVNVFVALFALLRCDAEIHIPQVGLEPWRLVARLALDGAMRPYQWKRGR